MNLVKAHNVEPKQYFTYTDHELILYPLLLFRLSESTIYIINKCINHYSKGKMKVR